MISALARAVLIAKLLELFPLHVMVYRPHGKIRAVWLLS